MLVAAGLLMAGAAVNGFGIRNPAPAGQPVASEGQSG
jgi:hypothetical protein